MFLGSNIHVGNMSMFGFVAGSGASYLLDTYPAHIAYSTALLSSTYAGSCLRVRRASDNAEADIGFADGWLDESAVATHCGASAGFVVTWYDQSGNGSNATQAGVSDQPQIYNGSAVTKTNGKPALVFDGSSDFISWSAQTISQPTTVYHVWDVTEDTTSFGFHYSWGDQAADVDIDRSGSKYRMGAGGSFGFDPTVTNKQCIWESLYNSTSSSLWVNGESATGNAQTGGTYNAGAIGGTSTGVFEAKGQSQAFLFYNSDQSSNAAEIRSELNTLFSAY